MSATANDVITALLAQLPGVVALQGVAIVDGPPLQADQSMVSTDRLFVGASADQRGLAAEGSNEGSPMPGVIDVDTFSVACLAEAWTGDTNPASRRARVFEIRDAVRTLIRPSSAMIVLGVQGLSSAHVGAWSLLQLQTPKGIYAGLEFRIDCEARPSTV